MNVADIDKQTNVPPSSAAARLPILFRLPKPGSLDPFFGGSRSYWNTLVLATDANGFRPLVKSLVDRKRGATRGVRFIVFESALAYFRQLESEQTIPATTDRTEGTQR